MKRLLLLITILLFSASSAQAATWRAKVEVTAASPNPAYIARVERAITKQVNEQVDRHWNVPTIKFVASGPANILVRLESPQAVDAACDDGADGCHSLSENGTIVLDVNRWTGCQGYAPGHCDGFQDWPPSLSHEMIEGLVDPTGGLWSSSGLLEEACDPVDGVEYLVDGIGVSDFVFPRWFDLGLTGQMDQHAQVFHSHELGAGGYDLESNGNYLGGAASDLS